MKTAVWTRLEELDVKLFQLKNTSISFLQKPNWMQRVNTSFSGYEDKETALAEVEHQRKYIKGSSQSKLDWILQKLLLNGCRC